jgi:hypothetical protein
MFRTIFSAFVLCLCLISTSAKADDMFSGAFPDGKSSWYASVNNTPTSGSRYLVVETTYTVTAVNTWFLPDKFDPSEWTLQMNVGVDMNSFNPVIPFEQHFRYVTDDIAMHQGMKRERTEYAMNRIESSVLLFPGSVVSLDVEPLYNPGTATYVTLTNFSFGPGPVGDALGLQFASLVPEPASLSFLSLSLPLLRRRR